MYIYTYRQIGTHHTQSPIVTSNTCNTTIAMPANFHTLIIKYNWYIHGI